MKKISSITLIILNVISSVFIVWYHVAQTQSMLFNVLAILMVITFVLNVIYAACMKRKEGTLFILSFILLILMTLGGTYLTQTLWFKTSFSIFSVFTTLAICVVAVFMCFWNTKAGDEDNVKLEKHIYRLQMIFAPLGMIVLVVFALFGWDVVFNSGYSFLELWIHGVLPFFALITVAVVAFLLRFLFLQKEKGSIKRQMPTVVAVVLLGAMAMYGSLTPVLNTSKNIDNAEAAYKEAFGDTYLKQDVEGVRPIQFSVPELFYNVKTTGYEKKTDVLYYESTQGEDKGLKLSYDVYYPDNTDEASPVLIRMHGWGGDKGMGHYPMPNKYFASRGYVVFDIQYGNPYEKQDTPYVHDYEITIEDRMFYINEFFRYAVQNNFCNADWNSVFISGNSHGGMLANAYARAFTDNILELEKPNIKIKGILPIYPSSRLAEDDKLYNPFISTNENTPPMLMFMGSHDGYVDREIAYYLPKAYEENGNGDGAVIWLEYATHGGDGYFGSSYMQIYLYYMERFMTQYR